MNGDRFELDTPRDLGALLSSAFALYRAHFRLFAVLALAVAIPVDLVLLGVAGGQLTGGFDTHPKIGAQLLASAKDVLLLTPLITAVHVFTVQRIAAGHPPSVGEALEQGFERFAPLLGTILLAAVAAFGGLLLLILPGVYFGVCWYLSAQVVVVEGSSFLDAMRRSRELVTGMWWRVFGIAIVFGLVAAAIAAILAIPILAIADAADSGAIGLMGQMVVDAVSFSFAAITGTLLYFDLLARHAASSTQPNVPESVP